MNDDFYEEKQKSIENNKVMGWVFFQREWLRMTL